LTTLHPESCHSLDKGLFFFFYSTNFLGILTWLVVRSTSGETNENVYLFLNSFQKSDAMLYAPRIQDFPDNCTEMVLNCYMLELKMVLREEEIEDNLQECVHDFNSNLQPSFSCETYTLQNITTFMERLMDLLQKLNST
uniref:Uncharacterized protein n=1 Tax=Oreochromis niloticus TaxID=8128 RepID=A0A669CGX8_ORENI